MNSLFPLIPLADVLTERRQTPDLTKLLMGEMPIVSKIRFNDGRIELRDTSETRTGMIQIEPGDLVVSGINAAKGAIAVYDVAKKGPIAATIHYGAYVPKSGRVVVKYLWWLLRSHTFRELLVRYVPGGIKTELKGKRLLPIPVPMPKLQEQRWIVGRIEELSAKIKEARGLSATVVSKSAILLRSAVNALTTEFSKFGLLDEVLEQKPRNGWSARCDNADSGIPVLTLGAVTGYRYDGTAYKKTSMLANPDAHYWLRPNDLLLTRSNTPDLVGHAAIYDGHPSPCIYSDLIMRVPVDETRADKRFVWYWLQSPAVREYIGTHAKGTSPTMKKISQGVVMCIPFPCNLPMPEQCRIVAYLDNLQAKVDALKKLQKQTQAELNALLPSILDKAFKGEL